MRIIEAKNQELNRYHIETSQWPGFCMIKASIMKGLNVKKKLKKKKLKENSVGVGSKS